MGARYSLLVDHILIREGIFPSFLFRTLEIFLIPGRIIRNSFFQRHIEEEIPEMKALENVQMI